MKLPRDSGLFTSLTVLSVTILCCGCSASFQAGLVRTYAHTRALTMAGYEKAMADNTDKSTASIPGNVRFPREVTEYRFEGMQVFRMEPADDSKPILFYLHGGAYAKSFDKNHWKSLADIARQTGCGLIAPNYPLLPRHTALEAHRLVMGLYADLVGRVPANRIVVAGDSAGGGFSLALAQEVRDAGLPLPGLLILISPFVDIAGGDESLQKKDTWLHVDACKAYGLRWADGLDDKDPRVSPLYGDMHGLPPTVLFSGTWEVFYTDILKTEQKLREAGVETTLYTGEKFGHVYPLYPIPEGKKVRKEISRMIRPVPEAASERVAKP